MVSEDRSNALIGRVLQDRYRIDELIAAGGIGAVYRGMHLKMRKEIAIKVLHPHAESFSDLVHRFEREAVAGAHITHPNVASASDMGTFDGGSCFLVQEFVRGRTLRDLIDADAPLSPARAIHLIRQLALGLGAAHDKGIVHRDLKPRNVMVTAPPAEVVKLIDFGFAKVPMDRVAPSFEAAEGDDRISHPDVVFGSVSYMAPEITKGMDQVDSRSDLYSLGIIFYEMLAGRHPFDPGEAREVLARHCDAIPPAISKRNPATRVPPALEAIVMRLIEKDPARRYSCAAELVQALGPSSREVEDFSAPRAFAAAPRGREKTSSQRAVLGGAAVLVGAVAIAGFVMKGRGSPEPAPAVPPTEIEPAAAAVSATAPVDIAGALRGDLLKAATSADDAESAAVLVALADADKTALRDRDLFRAATQVALRVGAHAGDDAAQVFYVLSYRFGGDGLDVLYAVSEDDKNPKSARRAAAVLEKQASSERASPALRVAVELRKAACRRKPTLFARAASDGDVRALSQLEALKPPACDPDGTACCFRHHVGLEKALEALRAKPPSK
jgi:serine/threonine-protein kinase